MNPETIRKTQWAIIRFYQGNLDDIEYFLMLAHETFDENELPAYAWTILDGLDHWLASRYAKPDYTGYEEA